jgi:NAD(P)-dependent dehydrogenase (short-subunit alcohol dehydrogenase family)
MRHSETPFHRKEQHMTTNMNEHFTGKVAFVTGAANGIGRATALAFAREGANVVVADVSEEGNEETARLIEKLGTSAVAVRCDVSQADQVKAALDKTIQAFGRLDFAFNNAGVEQPITRRLTSRRMSGTESPASISVAFSSA